MASQRELSITRLLERDLADASEAVDMQIACYARDDTPIIRVGGKWNQSQNRYIGPADTEVQIDLAPSQYEAATDFAYWLRKHLEIRQLVEDGTNPNDADRKVWGDETPIYTMFCFGGRRGGKSWLACLCAAIYAVTIPRARVVLAAPTQKECEELRAAIATFCIPANWRRYNRADAVFALANGSRIELLTGAKTNLKVGPCDLVVMNEAQEQTEVNRTDLSGNTIDVGGLTILTANPPRTARGQWVQEFHDRIASNDDPKLATDRKYFFDPDLNPFVQERARASLARSLGGAAYRREILGDMGMAVGDVVLSMWSDSHNLIPAVPPSWRDVTAIIAERYYGATGITRLFGADFDARAGCCAVSGRFFQHPNCDSLERAILVIDWSHRFINNTEDEFPRLLSEAKDSYGYDLIPNKKKVLIIADASGAFQSTERQHTAGDLPSWRRLQRAGFSVAYPDPKQNRNPLTKHRLSCGNTLLMPAPVHATGDMEDSKIVYSPRVLFTRTAGEVLINNRKYPLRKGQPDRHSEHAHLVDAWTYLAWRRWGVAYNADEIQMMR